MTWICKCGCSVPVAHNFCESCSGHITDSEAITPITAMHFGDPVIYVLITVGHGIADPNGSRAWGWFETKEQAEDAIMSESNDAIFESGSYRYAVIEETGPGISGEKKTWWYGAEYHEGPPEYYLIATLDKSPLEWQAVVGFGLG